MFDVLKGTLTRRLLLLFFALSIVPTLAMVIIPLFIQASEERAAVAELEASLQQNAENTFSRLVNTKADHYEQRLNERSKKIELFLELLTNNDQTTWESYANWLFENDPIILNLLIRNPAGDTYCRSREDVFNQCFATGIDFEVNSTEEINIQWDYYIDPVKQFTHIVLIANKNGNEIMVFFDLQAILDEVPRFGLAPRSTLLFVSDSTEILGIPVWGDVELLDQLNLQKSELLGVPLQSSMPLTPKDTFEPSEFTNFIKDEPQVFHAKFLDEKVYFAIRKIENTPYNVILMLPLTDIYGQATSYGASLTKSELPPAVMQGIISAVGFLFVIFIGAMIALRVIASPIKSLHEGATALSKNKLDTRVPETGMGEMTDLAISFNHMAKAIQDTQRSLESKQTELEYTLEARVEELNAMNGIIEFTNADLDLTKKLNGVVHILHDTLEIYNASIFLLDPNGKLNKVTSYFSETTIVNQEIKSTDIDIVFRDETLGKLILDSYPNQPINPIHSDFLLALAKTIGVVIINAELQNQVRAITISDERRHLARELHDSVTQTLFSVSLAAEGLKSAIGETENPNIQRAINLLSDQLTQVRSEMRGLIIELRPINLEDQSLELAIQGHASSLQRSTNMKIDTQITGDIENLSHDLKTGLNRIVQEGLSNIARHARANKVLIRLTIIDNSVELLIQDNGIGFNVEEVVQHKGSYGLLNIRERSEIFGGSVKIRSNINQGTTITVIIPIEEKQDE